jgi:hypothetical protein
MRGVCFPLKADMLSADIDARYVPEADVRITCIRATVAEYSG